MLATYLLTLSGTPIVYEGGEFSYAADSNVTLTLSCAAEEIGMINAPKHWDIEKEYKDVQVVNTWRECREAAAEENRPELIELAEEGELHFRRHREEMC